MCVCLSVCLCVWNYVMQSDYVCNWWKSHIFHDWTFSFNFSFYQFSSIEVAILYRSVAITHHHRRNVYVNIIRSSYFISGSMIFARASSNTNIKLELIAKEWKRVGKRVRERQWFAWNELNKLAGVQMYKLHVTCKRASEHKHTHTHTDGKNMDWSFSCFW